MIEAKQLVENLLDGSEQEPVDPKEMATRMKDAEDAEAARLKSQGTVNAQTVTQYGTIWHRTVKNSDGTAARAKVTSIKTWVTRPNDFQIGWKHGMRDYGTITPANASEWTTVEPPPVPKVKRRR
jgi:hypothetical protein